MPLLTTTASPSSWQNLEDRVLLGPWCETYSQYKNRTQRYPVLNHPWEDPVVYHDGYLYCQKIIEDYLSYLHPLLNKVHHLNWKRECWKILLEPWLGSFIINIYEKYCCLDAAFKSIPNLKGIGGEFLSEKIPVTTSDYRDSISEDDDFHLHIYTTIMQLARFPIAKINPLHQKASPSVTQKNRPPHLPRLHSFFSGFSKNSNVIISNELFNSWETFRLSTSGLNWRFLLVSKEPTGSLQKTQDLLLREKLFTRECNGTFQKVCQKLLVSHLPILYLEGFSSFSQKIDQKYGELKLEKMVTTSQHFNEELKFLSALYKNRGAHIFYAQHGGGYGLLKHLSSEDYEKNAYDRFLCWGWSNPEDNTFNIPAVRLSRVKKRFSRTKKASRIIFFNNRNPKFFFRFMTYPFGKSLLEYLEDEIAFISNLSPESISSLTIRLYPKDYGTCQKEKLKDAFPNICLEDPSLPLSKSLDQAKLVICNNNTTTFLECLCANIPVVLLARPSHFPVREKAIPYFEALREVGIVQECPLQLAGFINKEHMKIEKWWYSEKLQKARIFFIKQYAWLPDKNLFKATATTLNRLAVH